MLISGFGNCSSRLAMSQTPMATTDMRCGSAAQAIRTVNDENEQ